MAGSVELRPLERSDDRTDFSCGDPELDRYFEHYAGQNQFKLHLAVTYVAVLDERLVGFATVAASSLERANIPGARLRKRLPGYREGRLLSEPVPMFLGMETIEAALGD